MGEAMMELSAYLNRVQVPGIPAASVDTLLDLHQAHVFHIPFETLDVLSRVPITLDPQRFYDKIVISKRGGFCYEVNGLLKTMLDQIGFQSWFIACQVYVPASDSYGRNLGHVAIITEINQELYLVDVGFGSGFIQPLRVVYDLPQFQFGTWYRLRRLDEEIIVLERSPDGQQYQPMYKLSLAPRAFSDFQEMCLFHQTSPEAPFTRQPLCSRPTPEGRITLTGTALIITRKGERSEYPIASDQDFNEKLALYFGIALPSPLRLPSQV
ncbi:MAG: arylamine N-acetyltransferase family protein [Adhaeribacter sp.]